MRFKDDKHKILEDFNRNRSKQIQVAAIYERNGSYEMAYIALWSVLETGLKDISPFAKELKLLDQINQWKFYIEGGTKQRPKEIGSFQTAASKNIPPTSLIETLLGPCTIIREILNTISQSGSTKWRDKRNRIAHNAEGFRRLETYQEYKSKLLDGIDEFVELLSSVQLEK